MFRRRRMNPIPPLSADQIAVLVKANQLMAQGKPLEAGASFTGLAATLQQSNHPRRAANLYARAAHAFADGGNAEGALSNARQALGLFTQTGMAPRAAMFYAHITRKMDSHGMQVQAETLRKEFSGKMAVSPAVAPARRHGLLPTSCPKCEAPLHPDELIWVDENTVECEFCGTLIHSE